MTENRRSSDRTGVARVTCWLANRAMEFWDFIDKRDIDKHVLLFVIVSLTWKCVEWSQAYALAYPEKSGMDLGLVIAAVLAPFTILQGAAIKWYFDARAN